MLFKIMQLKVLPIHIA